MPGCGTASDPPRWRRLLSAQSPFACFAGLNGTLLLMKYTFLGAAAAGRLPAGFSQGPPGWRAGRHGPFCPGSPRSVRTTE